MFNLLLKCIFQFCCCLLVLLFVLLFADEYDLILPLIKALPVSHNSDGDIYHESFISRKVDHSLSFLKHILIVVLIWVGMLINMSLSVN